MTSLIPYALALTSAALMACALPKVDLPVCAIFGMAGLFFVWFGARPKRAFLLGWIAGLLFFSITASWTGETAGALIAPFGFLLVLIPSALEALAFGLAGMLTALAWQRARPHLAPLAGAAAFAGCEWLRSSGPFGAPFEGISTAFVSTPVAPLLAFVGSFGTTFALAVVAAYLAHACSPPRTPPALRASGIALLGVTITLVIAWLLWPARNIPTNSGMTVAALQGNIRQELKWSPQAFKLSIERYVKLTESLAPAHPAIVLWPETVITTNLNMDPTLMITFQELARRVHAELIVGSLQLVDGSEYNALYFFTPDGRLDDVYRKRQLVPFAETLPFPEVLGKIAVTSLVSRFAAGDVDGVINANGSVVGPLICWESAFSDLAVEDVRSGANLLLIATDDAWFGTSAGPYQHAQIAQVRALETGTWVLRAGATGISELIAPNGSIVAQAPLGTMNAISGLAGVSPGTPYVAIGGSVPIAAGLALLYIGIGVRRRRRYGGSDYEHGERLSRTFERHAYNVLAAEPAAGNRILALPASGIRTTINPLRKRILITAACLFLGYVAYELWLAGEDTITPPAANGPLHFGEGTVRGEREGGHSWSISYEKITSDANQSVLQIDGVRKGLFYQKNKPLLEFTAEHAVVNVLTSDFSASGKVHVESVDRKHPRAFDTDLLQWSQATQQLDLPNSTIFHSRSSHGLTTGSLTLDIPTGTIHIKQMRGNFLP
ncbi:MAG TPA: apolipoprotein N-acyltransferase [Candidatus Baltobacteraceae bacterium]|nr:apolipoprotein N-acyltransferase [Candidatus Baltobacteraceae bacterium]